MKDHDFKFKTKRFARADNKSLNENLLIYYYLEKQAIDRTRTMVDVGAHFGGSLMRFVRSGWDVWAFEPDPENRRRLFERLSNEQAMPRRIDHRAVSNKSGVELEFYRSPVSAGISSLSKFHPTHEVALKVSTIALSDFVTEYGVATVDYLKIDVEGHDLFVLQGFPFEQIKPRVVLCEYEDKKTVPLGHNSKALADFLLSHGYHVYVSVWHPIIEYGTSHDWSLLRSYDGIAPSKRSWGNLIAFAEDPPPKMLRRLVRRSMKSGTAKATPTSPKHVASQEHAVVSDERLERVIEDLHTLTGAVEGHSKVLEILLRKSGAAE